MPRTTTRTPQPMECCNCACRHTTIATSRRSGRWPYIAFRRNSRPTVYMCNACYTQSTYACIQCGDTAFNYAPDACAYSVGVTQNGELTERRTSTEFAYPPQHHEDLQNFPFLEVAIALAKHSRQTMRNNVQPHSLAMICQSCRARNQRDYRNNACNICASFPAAGTIFRHSAFCYTHSHPRNYNSDAFRPLMNAICGACHDRQTLPCADCDRPTRSQLHNAYPRPASDRPLCPSCVLSYTHATCPDCGTHRLEPRPTRFNPRAVMPGASIRCRRCTRNSSPFTRAMPETIRPLNLPKHLLGYHQGKQYTQFLHAHGKRTRNPKPDHLYLGAEIEVYIDPKNFDDYDHQHYTDYWADAISSHVSKLPLNDLITAERDGSVWPGMELCTMPAEPALWHAAPTMKDSGIMWQTVAGTLKALRNLRYRAHNAKASCGMHVSVPRDYLTPLRMYRLIALVHSNRDLFLAISQRRPADMAQWTDIPQLDKTQQIEVAGKKAQMPSRYVWLNLSRHRAEFRMFRANMRPERIQKNMDTVRALLDWANSAPLTFAHEGAAWIDFIQSRREHYPALNSYIQEIAPKIATIENPRKRSPIMTIGAYQLAPYDPYDDDDDC